MGAAGAEGALHVEQDVLRLDVPVDDLGLVGGGQAVGHVRDDRDGGLGGETAFAVQAGAQIGAAYEVHDQGEVVAVHHEVPDGDHVGVVEPEQGGAFLYEAADQLLVGREVLTEQLDGDRPLGPLTEPHRAGAAAPQDLVGRVPAADIPCQDCSLSGWRWTPGRQSYAALGVVRARDGAEPYFSGRNPPGEVDKGTRSALSGAPGSVSVRLRPCRRRIRRWPHRSGRSSR